MDPCYHDIQVYPVVSVILLYFEDDHVHHSTSILGLSNRSISFLFTAGMLIPGIHLFFIYIPDVCFCLCTNATVGMSYLKEK
jgi:hypothetical protein